MSQKLNDTQRKLVEDNHNLIYSFLNKRNLGMDEVEDWYGTAAIGLCKAAKAYNPDLDVKFSTFAYVCMNTEVVNILRKNKNEIKALLSLTESMNGNEDCILENIVPDKDDCFFSVYLNDAIDIATKKMSERNRKIIDLLLIEGYTQVDVAKMFGMTRSNVSRIYNQVIDKVEEYFRD